MLSEHELFNILESIFFVSGEPVNIHTLSDALLINDLDLKIIIENYSKKLEEENRGIKIVKLEDNYQMVSNPKYYSYIEKVFQKSATPALSEAMLETLAIICYKQPVTKADISSIRGINSDYNINKLLQYNIICEKGRADTLGRPILFGTTDEFLKYYGISSIEEFKEKTFINIEDIELEANEEVSQISLK